MLTVEGLNKEPICIRNIMQTEEAYYVKKKPTVIFKNIDSFTIHGISGLDSEFLSNEDLSLCITYI